MSQGDDRIVVQLSWDFANAAQKLLHKTEVFHISQEEIIAKLPDLVDGILQIRLPWVFIRTTSISLNVVMDPLFQHTNMQKIKK